MNEASLLSATGAVIEAIGAKGFAPALTHLLRSAVRYSYTVAFVYRGAARPIDLFDDFPAEKRKIFVSDYLEGHYLLDPFYLAAQRAVTPGLYRMRELAPDRFYQGEYYRSYYAQTGLAEEVAYFVDVAPGEVVVISLMRAEKVFPAREIAALQGVAPIILTAVRRHWSTLTKTPLAPPERVQEIFHGFGKGILTPREREIVEHTLKGHSAEAVGAILNIAAGTVRIHRRNVYAKLRISSQGELFSRFIQTLGKV